MIELFIEGGPVFMGILTLELAAMIIVTIINGGFVMTEQVDIRKAMRKISYIKSVGLLALVTGILGQLIGIYYMFVYIEMAGDVNPAIIFGGLKVSMITTLYGFFIYLLSLLIWLGLSWKLKS